MTISSATNRNNYTGTGSTDTYSYTFKIIADTDLLVTQRDTNDVETTLVLTTDYTVTGAGDASGGTIVLVAGNLPTGYVLSIRRVRPLTQGTDIRNQGDFFPEVHEDAFDHLVMLAQQLQDQIDRATLLPETSPSSVSAALPLAEPLKLVRWNAAGTALENITLASLGSVVSVSRGLSLTANDLAMLDLIPFLKGADVASADTLILGSDGNYFDITGTTGITAINTVAVGALIILQFDDALTITHHATNLRLQGETDITTAAGDHAIFVEYATGQWRMLAYSRSASAPAISNQVGVSDTQTLTNKTLTSPTLTSPTLASPTLNTSLSGSAFLDEDNMASDAADKAASQQSIKAYVDARTVTNGNFHDHVGGDGAAIPEGGLAAAAVNQTSLKTAQGSVSASIIYGGGPTKTKLTLPGGEYGFYPKTRYETSGSLPPGESAVWAAEMLNYSEIGAGAIVDSGYITHITLTPDASGVLSGSGNVVVYAQQRYLQSSPPYKIGNINWGHFLFLLRRLADGFIVASYEAEDPPWAYNGPDFNPKDSKERIQAVPHPFADYFKKDPVVDGLEIQLVDLSDIDIKQIKIDKGKEGKSLVDDLSEIITKPKGKIIAPAQAGIGNIEGFTNIVKMRKRN